MHVLAVVGPSDSGKTSTVAALADWLRGRGSVGTIKRLTHEPDLDTEGKDTARHRAAGATTTIGITDDVGWFATGSHLTLGDALETLARNHEYALVEGFSESSLPKLALAGSEPAAPVVARARDHTTVDIESVVELIEGGDRFVTLPSLVEDVKRSESAAEGDAVATITARVSRSRQSNDATGERATSEQGARVRTDRIAAIRESLRARDGVEAVRLHRRTGVGQAAKETVLVAIRAAQRDAALAAASDCLGQLEDDVVLAETEVTMTEGF
ncbi:MULTISPECIES: molybdopterin-guanine dinucleotide biosynthesis protein B [Salinibaculum]|uniref:molybdopterin-guanine dinucleotide biosynthesis protein B n=1 Tax=Salinibaculum TaxID=2732368 RepID=UPI0030D2D3CC